VPKAGDGVEDDIVHFGGVVHGGVVDTDWF
jgi:hypothetical protein